MKIPKSFELFGETITVVFKDDLIFEEDSKGSARFRRNEICLQTKEDSRPDSQVQQVFFHELVHWMFHLLNYDKFCEDEQLVDTFSRLLYQALKTAKY